MRNIKHHRKRTSGTPGTPDESALHHPLRRSDTRAGVEALTPSRALIAELVRRYWVLGMECSMLEIQKLAWFLEQAPSSASEPRATDRVEVAVRGLT
jgi:hypothetical protein